MNGIYLRASTTAVSSYDTNFWVLGAIYIAAKLGIADLLKDESKRLASW
jgi:hypothetical protein